MITSSVRSASVGQIGGYFRVLDLEQGRVPFVAPVPESQFRAVDPNPRGGQRGGRGVSVHDRRLVLGNDRLAPADVVVLAGVIFPGHLALVMEIRLNMPAVVWKKIVSSQGILGPRKLVSRQQAQGYPAEIKIDDLERAQRDGKGEDTFKEKSLGFIHGKMSR